MLAIYTSIYFRAVARGGGGEGGLKPPQFLADQLTLSQPGGHILPTQYYEPPQIFRPCDGPVVYIKMQ